METKDGGARRHRKTAQLCRQVYVTLFQSLAGLGEEALLEASIESVLPTQGGSALLVTVIVAARGGIELQDVHAALERANGRLRADVAAAITRRHVPELIFIVRPQSGVAE